MKKPRIAFVISHPIQHFCPMYASLAEDDSWEFKVFFASTAGLEGYFDPNFNQKISWKGIDINSFSHHFLNGDEPLPISAALDAPSVAEELDAYQPDVVVLYGYSQKVQRRAYFWAKRNNKKIFYTSDSEVHGPRPIWKDALKYIPLRWYFSHVDACLSVGNANENYYYQYGVPTSKLFRHGYPIDARFYDKAYEKHDEKRAAIREEYNIPADEFVCAMVGKLVPWKAQHTIIDALKVLEDKGVYGVTGMMMGSGVDMESLQEKAKILKHNRVILTGFVEAITLCDYYAAADVYVHTSNHEPHSVAISEAIYMGKPLIISDHCGSYGSMDDLQLGKNGFVYPFGKADQLALRIQQFLQQPELVKEFGDYSHKYAYENQQRAHGGGLRAALRAYDFQV